MINSFRQETPEKQVFMFLLSNINLQEPNSTSQEELQTREEYEREKYRTCE
jgi:hypothetical protein